MSRQLMVRGGFLAAVAAIAGLVLGIIGHQVDQPAAAWFFEAFVLGAAFLAIGYLVFLAPARTIDDIAAAADRIALGDFASRASDTHSVGSDLVYRFNTMARRVEEVIEEEEADQARLEAVFNASTDPMLAVTAECDVAFLNAAAAQLFEAPGDTAIGRPLIVTTRDYELDQLVRRVLARPEKPRTEVIAFGADRIPLRAVAVPIEEGGTWSALLVLTDLTEFARLDQVRRDFLSNVSHELRTPLASIKALVETMESGAVDSKAESEEFLRRIRLQVDRITSLVDELLDLSRIESGALELNPEPIDLAELVAEAMALLHPHAERQEVKFDVAPGEWPVVEADRQALLRVVNNLLDNAIKYSPYGGTVQIEAHDEGDLVALSVHDDGPGINPLALPRVFERFYKTDLSRTNSGTGLGLAIVKHTARIHGGTASVESEPGKGATFTVRLPKEFVGKPRPPVGLS
ncbi:MAG: ATP-binding protein [Dehalococcoidia bacterium]|nr:ATP-binding protein [Dehalococcoidia bacterium]